MAPSDHPSTEPRVPALLGMPVRAGPRAAGDPGTTADSADGVSRVVTAPGEDLAHTMTLCGLGDVRSPPGDSVTRST